MLIFATTVTFINCFEGFLKQIAPSEEAKKRITSLTSQNSKTPLNAIFCEDPNDEAVTEVSTCNGAVKICRLTCYA